MSTVPQSPIEYAVHLAQQGQKVLWLDESAGIEAALKHLRESPAGTESVRAITGGARRRQVAVNGGSGLIYMRTSARAVRGMSADVVFCAERFRTPDALDEIAPALETAGLPEGMSPRQAGLVYQLFEQIV